MDSNEEAWRKLPFPWGPGKIVPVKDLSEYDRQSRLAAGLDGGTPGPFDAAHLWPHERKSRMRKRNAQ